MKLYLTLVALLFAGLGYLAHVEAQADPYSPVYVTSVHALYSPTPVGTASPVPIMTSTPGQCDQLEIFDSSGQTLELMAGPLGSEQRIRIIPPGGNGLVGQRIYSGTRVSVRAITGTANAGELDVTCLQF